MFRNLVANLLTHGQIETTVAKAKEVRRITERMITKAKRVGAAMDKTELTPALARRRLSVKRDVGKFLPKSSERTVGEETQVLDVVEHLFREVAPKFAERPGGYTRIIKTHFRRGDNAPMAIIQLLGFEKVKRAETAPIENKSPTVKE